MGPGAYNVNAGYKFIHERKPTWKFGSSERNQLKHNQVPGPGTYESKDHLSKSVPKYSFGTRLKSKYSTAHYAPGPGSYNPKYPWLKIGYSMRGRAKKKRAALDSQKVGPGAYDMPEVISKPHHKVVFPKSKRFKSKKYFNSVGPGSYDPKLVKSGIGYSMRS